MLVNPGRLHRSLWVEKVGLRILWNRELTKTIDLSSVGTERWQAPSKDLFF